MITRTATFSDIYAVWMNLSEQNMDEIEAAGLNPWTGLKMFRQFNLDNPGQVALLYGKPACVFGIIKSDKVTTTWFIATQDYFDHGMPAVLHARRYLRDRTKEHGTLTTVTLSKHPDVDRWFKLLGFKKVGGDGDAKVFEYA